MSEAAAGEVDPLPAEDASAEAEVAGEAAVASGEDPAPRGAEEAVATDEVSGNPYVEMQSEAEPHPPAEASAGNSSQAPSKDPNAAGKKSTSGPNDKGRQGKRAFPSILAELGMKVSVKGMAMPESRKNYLKRRREARELGLISWAPPIKEEDLSIKKRKQRSKKNQMRELAAPLDEMESDLFHAAFTDDLSLCQQVIDAGVNVNVRSNADLDGLGTSATALHVAAARGHAEVVEELLGASADATAVSGRRETPIQLATRSGSVDVVRMLSAAGVAPLGAENAMRLLNKAPAWDPHNKRMRAALRPDAARRPVREREHSGDQSGYSQGQLEDDPHPSGGKGRNRKGRSKKGRRTDGPSRQDGYEDDPYPEEQQYDDGIEDEREDGTYWDGARGHNHQSESAESPERSNLDEDRYGIKAWHRSKGHSDKGGGKSKGKKKGGAKGTGKRKSDR